MAARFMLLPNAVADQARNTKYPALYHSHAEFGRGQVRREELSEAAVPVGARQPSGVL